MEMSHFVLLLFVLHAVNKNTLEMVQYGVEGSSTFLECQARSPHALLKWHLQRDNSDRRKEVSASTPGCGPGGGGDIQAHHVLMGGGVVGKMNSMALR